MIRSIIMAATILITVAGCVSPEGSDSVEIAQGYDPGPQTIIRATSFAEGLVDVGAANALAQAAEEACVRLTRIEIEATAIVVALDLEAIDQGAQKAQAYCVIDQIFTILESEGVRTETGILIEPIQGRVFTHFRVRQVTK